MNLVNNYKNEICLMSLSADFKETLKQRCREELESNGAQGAGNAAEVSSRVKFYKYVSIAACLVAAVSTIGVVSLMSGTLDYSRKSRDSSANESTQSLEDSNTLTGGSESENALNGFVYDDEVDSSETLGAESADAILPDVEETEVEEEVVAEDTPVEGSETQFDVLPETAAIGVNSDYDGEYYTYDYVLALAEDAYLPEAEVFSDYEDFAAEKSSDRIAASFDTGYDALNFYDVLDNAIAAEGDNVGATLVSMEILGIVSDSQLPAPVEGLYTLYEVNINYDYLNLESCDIDAYVWIKGTESAQLAGMPVYAKGDDIFASLTMAENGSVTVVDEILYDVYTLNDVDIAYHRGYEDINPGYTDMGILDNEREFITTTTNNPVVYTHKASVKELSRYIRRKINEKELNYADLETLAAISRGEAVPAISDGSDDDTTFDDGTDVGDNIEPVTSLSLNVSDSDIALSYSGQNIILDDSSSASSMEAALKSSATGTISSGTELNMMFVGGKMTIKTDDQGNKSISGIEITSAGCPLDISFNGVKVGDSLESVVSALGITENMAPDCTVVFSSNSMEVTLSFEYGVLSSMTIK